MNTQQSETPQSGSPSPTPAQTPSISPAVSSSSEPVYDPTLEGNKIIYKKALEDLIRDTLFIIEQEGLESFYRNKMPAPNARTDRSDANELRGRYIRELHNRSVAIKNFIVKHTGQPESDYARDYGIFNDLSSEITYTQGVIDALRLRLGWLSENMDRLYY